jgi:hypothetical protein
VFEHWAEWFDVTAYLSHADLGFQDIVLLQRDRYRRTQRSRPETRSLPWVPSMGVGCHRSLRSHSSELGNVSAAWRQRWPRTSASNGSGPPTCPLAPCRWRGLSTSRLHIIRTHGDDCSGGGRCGNSRDLYLPTYGGRDA